MAKLLISLFWLALAVSWGVWLLNKGVKVYRRMKSRLSNQGVKVMKVRISKDVEIEGLKFSAGEYEAVYGSRFDDGAHTASILTIYHNSSKKQPVQLEIGGGLDTNFYNEFIEDVN